MTIDTLGKKLKELKIPEDRYYLHGLYGSSQPENKLALIIKKGRYTVAYEVYYQERGEKHSVHHFSNEKEACKYFLYQLQEELTLEKVLKVEGIGGMTVNERLWATGFMEEFDKAKKSDKSRAIQILRILGVDAPNIEKIVK